MTQQIAIQGEAGSFSHMATLKIFPNSPQIKFCATFEEACFLLATQKSEDKIWFARVKIQLQVEFPNFILF